MSFTPQVLQTTFFVAAFLTALTLLWFAYKPQRWLLPRFLLDPVEPLRRVLGYETSEQTLMGQMTPAKHVFWIRFFRESFISFRYFLEFRVAATASSGFCRVIFHGKVSYMQT
jgi:hypothetical protein